jgi:hypothetical protein
MPPKPLTDMEVLARSIALKGSQAELARWLEKTPAVVSHWKKDHALPPDVRRILVTELGAERVEWMDRGWREKRKATKALQQVMRIFYRTKGSAAEWAALEEFLDKLEPWDDKDWHDVWERHLDWISPAAAPRRRQGGQSR